MQIDRIKFDAITQQEPWQHCHSQQQQQQQQQITLLGWSQIEGLLEIEFDFVRPLANAYLVCHVNHTQIGNECPFNKAKIQKDHRRKNKKVMNLVTLCIIHQKNDKL